MVGGSSELDRATESGTGLRPTPTVAAPVYGNSGAGKALPTTGRTSRLKFVIIVTQFQLSGYINALFHILHALENINKFFHSSS